MTDAANSTGLRALGRHVAVRALLKSVLINLLAPALVYRLAAPHFAPASLVPLALSGVPPILGLVQEALRRKAIDILGLIALEGVVFSLAALMLAHDERGALIGRSLQDVGLAAIFLVSLVLAKPLVGLMTRQLMTGNDPAQAQAFDLAACRPAALHVYRALTWVWTLAMLIKAAGSYGLATHLHAQAYLIASPLWDLVSNLVLVAASLAYGRARLAAARETLVANLAADPV